MAFSLSGLADFTNEYGAEMVNKMVAAGKTFGYVTIQPGIKTADKINLISSTVAVAAGSCGWTASGTSTVGQKTLTVTPLQHQEALCIKDAEKKSLQYLISPGSKGDDESFASRFVAEKSAQLSLYNENYFWTNATYGIVPQLVAVSATTVSIGSAGTAISIVNVIGFIDDIKTNIPAAIATMKPICFVGTDTFDKLVVALKNANYFHIDPTVSLDYSIEYLGMTIVGTVGLNGTNKIVCTVKENLYLGTDLMDENDKFDVWYSRDNNEIRMAAYWKIGQTFLFPDFVVAKY